MNARNRVSIRVRNRSSNTSNASTLSSSRVRSTNVLDKSSPYVSLARRSNQDENRLSSSASKHPNSSRNTKNEEINIPESHLSNNEVEQVIVADQSDDNDDELLHNMSVPIMQANDFQPSCIHTTSTNNIAQKFSLNDNRNAMSTVLRDPGLQKNYVMGNDEVYTLFDTTANGLFRYKLCQQGKYNFLSSKNI